MPKLKDEEVRQLYQKHLKLASENWNGHYAQAEDDIKMYVGDQLTANQKKNLNNGKPALVINYLKKRVDLLVGQQMQNKTDIRVFPVEGEDSGLCDIYTQAIKWSMVSSKSYRQISQGFKNSIISGLGWLSCEVSFAKDIINGDITVRSEDPFRIMCDPNFKEMDLSDCRYIIRGGILAKEEAVELWPEKADLLNGIQAAVLPNEFAYNAEPYDNLKGYVFISEYWYRAYENNIVVVDTISGDTLEMDEERANFIVSQNPQYTIVKTRKPVIRLLILANNREILYHGPNPFLVNKYPFVPVMSTFTPDMKDYAWRFQGVIRPLKDLQHEKNKRRSTILQSNMTVANSGYIVEQGSVVDTSQLMGGTGRIIQYRPGSQPPKQIQPPPLQNAIMEMEAKSEADMMNVGMNPEMLGMKQESDTPGIVTQLRQKQGMMAVQEIFDNLSFAMAMLGNLHIDYINAFWTRDKVEAVVEAPVPANWDAVKYTYKHDCIVDESLNTPTARMAIYMQIMDMFKQGLPVDPRMIISKMELPQSEKEEMISFISQQMQPPPQPGGPQIPGGNQAAQIPPGM